jgi:hypothetical protein
MANIVPIMLKCNDSTKIFTSDILGREKANPYLLEDG